MTNNYSKPWMNSAIMLADVALEGPLVARAVQIGGRIFDFVVAAFQRWCIFAQITVKLVACNPGYALTGKPFFHNMVLVINSSFSLNKYSRVAT